MLPVKAFEARLRAILDMLDQAAEDIDDEDFDDLNAELEDALFMLSQIDPKSGDAEEELAGALEELAALKDDYARWPEAGEAAARLGMLIEMASANA